MDIKFQNKETNIDKIYFICLSNVICFQWKNMKKHTTSTDSSTKINSFFQNYLGAKKERNHILQELTEFINAIQVQISELSSRSTKRKILLLKLTVFQEIYDFIKNDGEIRETECVNIFTDSMFKPVELLRNRRSILLSLRENNTATTNNKEQKK